jgi:hypothetical protein
VAAEAGVAVIPINRGIKMFTAMNSPKIMSPLKSNCPPLPRISWLAPLGFVILVVSSCLGWAADERNFASSDEAIKALVTASENHDTNAIRAIFGLAGHQLVSPDAVQATNDYRMFVQRLKEKVLVITNSDTNLVLELGADGWPFPIPLVKAGDEWHFDTEAGRAEILNRRIGMDELGVIDVCHTYVQAQREYASEDQMGDGVLAYAQHLHSTPGTHDGLYWPADSPDDEDLSPLGPLIAQAHGEGYSRPASMINDQRAPYHGYYFKVLTAQGKHAAGGKYNYIINGRMIAGFALVAWPAQWGNTGVMTFIVNQQGKVYQRNLGKKTAAIASSMQRFDPDKEWTLVP